MLHAGLAGSMNAPEMILTKDEAETLARSTRNVLRHYSFGSVSQVRKDWFMLAVCLGGLYLPRFRKMAARAAAKTEEELPQNVYPLKSS